MKIPQAIDKIPKSVGPLEQSTSVSFTVERKVDIVGKLFSGPNIKEKIAVWLRETGYSPALTYAIVTALHWHARIGSMAAQPSESAIEVLS